jgi:hypothetical protein
MSIGTPSGDFQTDSIDELIERDDDSAVESVECAGFGIDEAAVVVEGLENGAGQRRVEFLKELQVDDATAITLGSKAISS